MKPSIIRHDDSGDVAMTLIEVDKLACMRNELALLKNHFVEEVENSSKHVHCERCQNEIMQMRELVVAMYKATEASPLTEKQNDYLKSILEPQVDEDN